MSCAAESREPPRPEAMAAEMLALARAIREQAGAAGECALIQVRPEAIARMAVTLAKLAEAQVKLAEAQARGEWAWVEGARQAMRAGEQAARAREQAARDGGDLPRFLRPVAHAQHDDNPPSVLVPLSDRYWDVSTVAEHLELELWTAAERNAVSAIFTTAAQEGRTVRISIGSLESKKGEG